MHGGCGWLRKWGGGAACDLMISVLRGRQDGWDDDASKLSHA